MKIAIMMRVMDQPSGVGFFTEQLLDRMLRMDSQNNYLLFYRTEKWFGRFSSFKNVKECMFWAPHKFFWDQLAVPYHAWKEDADVIFNPKFSVPLVSHCPVAMGLQEPVWWAWPEQYEWWDVLYMRIMLPRFCRKSSILFPWSSFNLEETRKYLKMPLEHVTVTYSAPKEIFAPIQNSEVLGKVRDKYHLPRKFIFGVTRVDHIGNDNPTFYSGKNVETTIKAFILLRDHIQHKLVIAGRNVYEYLKETGWKDSELEGIHFLGFLPHEELVIFLNIADLFVIPSFYEGFGFTLVEAMASGCPVVASLGGACPEVAENAAIFADPHKPDDFASKIMHVLKSEDLRQDLKRRGLKRSKAFNWGKTATLTLEGLECIANKRRRWDQTPDIATHK